MNIWIVNPFDNLPLEGNRPQRYWLLARALVRAGHDVTLWTSDFSHSRKAKRKLVDGGWLLVDGSRAGVTSRDVKGTQRFKLTDEGFELVMIETPGYKRNIGLARIWSHRVFAQRWRAAAEGEKAPDLLVTSLPPLALGAAALAFCRQHGVKLVVDVQDAWPETFERVVPRCLLAPLRKTAQKIYCGADAVVGVAQRYVDLAQSYGATSPMHVFRLGIARQSSEVPSSRFKVPDPPTNHQLPTTNHQLPSLRLAYLGNMGASYDLATVIAGVRGMENVTLDLAGSGPNEAALRELAADCTRIRFHGYLDEAALRNLLATCDAAVIPMFDAACVGVPGKLADYTAAGLPVLNTLAGETAKLLADFGAGGTYTAGDIAAFQAAVTRFQKADRAALRAGAAKLAQEFDAETVYGGYVAWVERLGRLEEGEEEG